jgi:TonB-dependent receptor
MNSAEKLRSHRLLGGVSLFAIGVVMASASALAQTAPVVQAGNVQEIVVTGLRAQVASAQVIKEDSEEMVDSITSVDIGALPDKSVTEALQRVPGVTIERVAQARDPSRVVPEGSSVQIRGMSWIGSEFNGRDTFAPDDGRALDFSTVPSELMAGVDVYKSPSADQIEGGIGGIVNLRTRLPFDQKGLQIAYNFDYQWGDLVGQGRPEGSIMFSDRWKTSHIGEIGLLVDFSYSDLLTRANTFSIDPYTIRTDVVSGQTVETPDGFNYRTLEDERKREGLIVALQWRPTETLEITAQEIHQQMLERQTEYGIGIDEDTNAGAGTNGFINPVFDSNGNFVSGIMTQSMGNKTSSDWSFLDTRWNTENAKTYDQSLNMKWNPNEKWEFNLDSQYVYATITQLDWTMFTSDTVNDGGALPPVYINLNSSNPVTQFTTPLSWNPADQNGYYGIATMDWHENNVAWEWAEKADAEYFFDNSWLNSAKIGVRYSHRAELDRQTSYDWAGIAPCWGGGSYCLGTTPTVAQLGSQFPTEPFNWGKYFSGYTLAMPVAVVPSATFLSHWPTSAPDLVKLANTYGGWWPSFNNIYSSTATGNNGIPAYVFQTETDIAGYGIIRFKHDLELFGANRPIDGNIGVRVVDTKAQAYGNTIFNTISGYTSAMPASAIAYSNGSTTAFNPSHEYLEVLPAFNIRDHITNDLQWRFAASQGIYRPDFQQLTPSATISATLGTLSGGTCTTSGATSGNTNCVSQYTATAGNPDLKPMHANQFDTSLEWYFAKTGSLTGDLFYKDIHDFITNGTGYRGFTNGGVTNQVLVQEPYNGGAGKVDGFELGYHQFFDFLPSFWSGIGLDGNYTLINSSGARNGAVDPYNSSETGNVNLVSLSKLPLEGLSNHAYNIALLYEYGGLSLRTAYSWRSHYLLSTTEVNTNVPDYAESYGQLDFSAFYSVLDNVKLGVLIANLAGARTYIDAGLPGDVHRQQWVTTDRRYSFAIRGTF